MAKINIEDAKKRLQKPQSFGASDVFKAQNATEVEYVDTVNDNMFIFKVDKSYVLSPADDTLDPVIGEFDELPEDGTIPPCLQDWLSDYSEEINYFQENEEMILESYIEEETYGGSNITLVDLGLSVKWGNMNLGSLNPEDSGYYYAWGEVDTKTSYKWSTYKYGDGKTADNLGNIEKTKYDAVFVQNNALCLPTKKQYQELIDKCIWTKTTLNNKNVWEVKGPNGNKIYFPINGCKSESSSISYTNYVYCWTGTQSSSNLQAEVFRITDTANFFSMQKRTGAAIRPVSVDENKNAIELVDLGLSVNWANMNVGASNPEDAGNYYAWAELEPKDNYSWDNYKYYVKVPESYTNIGSNISKTEYDQAYSVTKSLWLPTTEQWNELQTKCTFKVITKNNIKGYEVKGPNGNTIFLPFGGNTYDGKTYNVNVKGYYHSANIGSTEYQFKCARFGENSIKDITELRRRTGSSIRPVSSDKSTNTDINLVDLGLSINWADRNLGATKPEEVGDFYAWGDTEANKKNFNWASYKYYTAAKDESKDLGTTITQNDLYDVAFAKNNNMCIPKASHWEELLSKCTWTETTKNNIKGYEVKGPTGKSIFLPTVGYKLNNELKYNNEYAAYTTACYYSTNVNQYRRTCDWKNGVKASIKYTKKYIGTPVRPISVQENNLKKYIKPIMPYKWSQGSPFNNALPIDPSTNKRVITGCSQTAFGMLLAYYGNYGINGKKYRKGITKTEAYTSKYSGKPTMKMPALPSVPIFDYDNMNFIKASDFKTEESKNAVAKLMKHIGYADKALYASSGTGAYATDVLNTAKNKVHISDTGKLIYASSGLQKFKDSIYKELSQGYPVLVSGYGTGGHAFICDGYDPATDKFHFNWGWSGSYNGWFDMAVLKPGNYNFSNTKIATVELHPEHILGDVNGDSVINIVDVTELVNAILNGKAYDYKYDLNYDGVISQTDIELLVEIILGKK